jgi:hypothetical protein
MAHGGEHGDGDGGHHERSGPRARGPLEAGADDAQAEEQERESSGRRAQRFGGLSRCPNVQSGAGMGAMAAVKMMKYATRLENAIPIVHRWSFDGVRPLRLSALVSG